MLRTLASKTLVLLIALGALSATVAAVIGASFEGRSATEAQSETFFEQFVVAGGPIVWFVLLPMSLVAVYLTAQYALTVRRKELLPEATGERIVQIVRQFGPGQLDAALGQTKGLVSIALRRAVSKGGGDWFRMRNLVFESLEEQGSGLLRRIEWINLIGNVSPMVGLFGTVFGMIKLFKAIVTAGGQPQPAHLADGISVALVTTFWGLLIAIPALAVNGIFRSRIETLLSDAATQAENVLPQILRSLSKWQDPARPVRRKSPLDLVIGQVEGRSPRTLDKSAASS
ncbi:MAG: MotA/TolQ/ExbB proton channel family protein [Planctomycetota bacterium]